MAAGASLPLSLQIADAILLLFFLVISIAAPLIDAQTCLPTRFFPQFLVDLKSWHANEYGDFLMLEKPGFFVGLVWLEIVFQWPLALANIVGIIGRKSWYRTTCLIYGVSTSSGMI
ncbi:uncharacterized protein LOC131221362 [Magnolia sinica]|uniref:uncharacterized protein LOC131221362 n=1 Tax=Magnolia sinica TaxID=86752 RepID=UPI00265879BE|nr:uncharacterized protein LOC131221362 [Magnolia sinica]